MKIKKRLKTCFLKLFDGFLKWAIKLRIEGESWKETYYLICLPVEEIEKLDICVQVKELAKDARIALEKENELRELLSKQEFKEIQDKIIKANEESVCRILRLYKFLCREKVKSFVYGGTEC